MKVGQAMGSRSRGRVTMHDVHLAIKLKCVNNIRWTLSNDLSVDVNQSLFGATALSLSLYYQCDEAFNLIIDRHLRTSSVDLDQLSNDPQRRLEPALITAVRLGNELAVDRLLECGADIEAVDGFGHTALWTAARDRRFNIAVTLLKSGATVRPSSRSSSLPVFVASRLSSRRTDMTQLLLLAGADDNSADHQSLLRRVLAPQRYTIIRLLLAACHVTLTRDVTSLTRDNDVDNLLRVYMTSPASLQSQCRWTIRRVTSRAGAGIHFLSALSRLPLPKPLREYVALIDVLNENENDSFSWTQLIHQLGFS